MRLHVQGLAVSAAILAGGTVFVVGVARLVWPDYGLGVLQLAASIYPGYEVGGFGSVIVGSLYAALDGAIGGALLAWLYNRFSRPEAPAAAR